MPQLPLTTEFNSENDAYLQQTYCIDVEGYKQAEEASITTIGETWDSNSLKGIQCPYLRFLQLLRWLHQRGRLNFWRSLY